VSLEIGATKGIQNWYLFSKHGSLGNSRQKWRYYLYIYNGWEKHGEKNELNGEINDWENHRT
jgi:hypothetical protein